jgi:hypothetical protein
VFTTRLAGGKGGRNGLENELRRLGITQISPTPNGPTNCGKVERLHDRQPPAGTLAELQTQLDAFVNEYDHHRPHGELPQRATPATTYTVRPKAAPGERVDTQRPSAHRPRR